MQDTFGQGIILSRESWDKQALAVDHGIYILHIYPCICNLVKFENERKIVEACTCILYWLCPKKGYEEVDRTNLHTFQTLLSKKMKFC